MMIQVKYVTVQSASASAKANLTISITTHDKNKSLIILKTKNKIMFNNDVVSDDEKRLDFSGAITLYYSQNE